ncbi:unnamed protein product, partial [Laminaria digitata]
GNLGDGIAVCGRRFHFLCAWFAGAYVKVGVTEPSFTRGERGLNGDMDSWPEQGERCFGFPTGLSVEVRCLEHSYGAPGRKGAPKVQEEVQELAGAGAGPGAAPGPVLKGTTVEAQSELRSKYRFKFQPEWQVEGKKKKKTKGQLKKEQKQAEREKQSTVRVSGPRALDPDSYDRYSCAVCMQLAKPMLLAHAAGAAEAAAGGAAEAALAARVREGVVECSACKVRVHRECYGVPEGVGAVGAGE